MTTQHVVTLQPEVVDKTGLAEQYVPSTISPQLKFGKTLQVLDVKGLGRPSEFTGNEEDVQQRSKKAEAFFAYVVKESEIMLEWSAEQVTENTMKEVGLVATSTNVDRGVPSLECVLQHMHTSLMALTSDEANDNVAEASCRLEKLHDATTGGRKRNVLRTIFSPRRCSLLELQTCIKRSASYVSRYEKKLNETSDDEIKLAGLEALVLEELEKHLILNSKRVRTFDDALLENRDVCGGASSP